MNLFKKLFGAFVLLFLVACGGGGDPTPIPIPGPGGDDPTPVVDTIKPVIAVSGVNPLIVEAGSAFIPPRASATDNKDGDITANIVTSCNVSIVVVGTYTCTYDVKDAAGNSADQQTLTVLVEDTTGPVIRIQGANPDSVFVGSGPYLDLGATASDAVDGARPVTTTGSVNDSVVGLNTLTYTSSDLSGNPTVGTRTVNVIAVPDTTLPVITPNGASPPLYVGDAFVPLGATAQDDVDGDITASLVENCNVDTAMVGTYFCTYNVSDSSGNPADQVVMVYDVVAVPMATSGKFLFPCYDPFLPFPNDDGWVCSFDLASGLLIRHWGGEQTLFGWHYPSVYPDKIIPSRVGGNIVFNGFNVPCLMIASMTTMAPTCAIPPASNVAFRGNPDLSVNGDIVLFAQGFDSLTDPYQQHIEMFLTDGTGLNAIEVTNSAADIDSSPVFATPTNKNSVSTDILFLRNGVDMMKLTVNNLAGATTVGPATVFESNVVGGFRASSVNATFTEVAFMKVADGEIFIFKKATDGSTPAVKLRKGTDPFWTTDGTDRILFTSNGARYSMASDGSDLKQIPYPSTLSTAVSGLACSGLCLGSIVSFPAGF